MTSKDKLADIQYLINEFYSTDEDRDGLSESAKESRKIFNQYCRNIKNDLEKVEKIWDKVEELLQDELTSLLREIPYDMLNSVKVRVLSKLKEWLKMIQTQKIDCKKCLTREMDPLRCPLNRGETEANAQKYRCPLFEEKTELLEGVSFDELKENTTGSKIKQIVNHYQYQQLDVAIEEMAELTKEICKFKRGKKNDNEIKEEIADVYLMLEQLCILFNITVDDVDEIINYKVDRTLERIENER